MRLDSSNVLSGWRMAETILDTHARLLALIAASGLSRRGFAERVLGRDERTLRHWIKGTSPIPPAATRWIDSADILPDRDVVTIRVPR